MALRLGTEGSLLSFTNELLKENVFICDVCSGLLRIPIISVKGIGNVCADCLTDDTKDLSLENTALTKILKKLKLPCKFQPEGCKKQVNYTQLEFHQSKCEYRTIQCLAVNKGCSWKGTIVNVLNHFQANHTDDIISCSNEPFFIPIPLSEINGNVGMMKLLVSKKSSYFVRLAINVDRKDEVFIHIYSLDHGNNREEIAVKYIGESGKYEITCNVVPLRTIDSEDQSVKLNKNIVREIAGRNSTLIIEISRNIKSLPEDIFECLECPICYKLMTSAIFLCNNGHSVCDLCRPKITQCPLCRAQTYNNMRNYTLEKLMAKIRTVK